MTTLAILKDNTYNEWQYIVWKENAHELEDAIHVAPDKGVKVFYIRTQMVQTGDQFTYIILMVSIHIYYMVLQS